MKSSWSIDDQSGFWAWKLWPSGIGLKDKLIRNFSHKTPTLDHQISHCLAVETRACLKTWNDMVTVVWPWSNRTRSFVPACQLQELGRVMKDDSFFYLFWDCNMIVVSLLCIHWRRDTCIMGNTEMFFRCMLHLPR